MATFRLGVVADALPTHDRFTGYLSIPYLHWDPFREEIYTKGMRFRCLKEHDHREWGHGKYMSLPDAPTQVFNVAAIHKAGDTVHVTEGEFDAIVLTQLGLNAIAIPGANAFAPHHKRMLAGFNRIWVWGDPDEAGMEFTNKVCKYLHQARGIYLSGGDITDNYLRHGGDHVLAQVPS